MRSSDPLGAVEGVDGVRNGRRIRHSMQPPTSTQLSKSCARGVPTGLGFDKASIPPNLPIDQVGAVQASIQIAQPGNGVPRPANISRFQNRQPNPSGFKRSFDTRR